MNTNFPDPIGQPPFDQRMAVAETRRRIKNGAINFYWIAGMSLVNTLIFLFGGNFTFVIGLGITQLVDGLALAMVRAFPALIVRGFGFLVDLFIAGLFVVFGIFAARGRRWAFVVGMLLYGLDALLMLAFEAWMGVIFHLVFLGLLFGGLNALKQLEKLIPRTVSDPAFPQSPGG